MFNCWTRTVGLVVCLTFLCDSALVSQEREDNASNSADEANSIDGLWSGSWGGGESDGVVFQPVMAELVVEGDRVEMSGFRIVDRLAGSLHIDASVGKLSISPDPNGEGQPLPVAIHFTYEQKGDELTLVDRNGFSISMNRVEIEKLPNANVQVEFLAARGINDSGDLLVTSFREIQVGQNATSYLQALERVLKTKNATVLLVQESGCKKVTIDEARSLIGNLSMVAVAWRDDNRKSFGPSHTLWKTMGTPLPDHELVWQTYATNLRPGTLVFVLSRSENKRNP